ncbi:MAG: NPCBM/NEW2 domain-containing protein [Phycisphaerales bacterium]|nr:NPCBM/NEW2 domain-containing protein [Phycisphaerales bacterium]
MMRRSVAVLVIAGIALLASAGQFAGVRVEASRIDGSSISGELRAAAPELRISTGDAEAKIAWSDLLVVKNLSPEAAAPATAPLRFTLSDGSSFVGAITAGGEREFECEPAIGGRFRIDLSALVSVRATGASSKGLAKLDALANEGGATEDVAVVSRGDQVLVLSGAARGATPDKLNFEWNGKVTAVGWDRVAGVIFARPTPRGASSLLTTTQGDIFAGRISGGDAESIVLQSGLVDRIALPWARVAKIECRSDRYVFLSDLKPQSYRNEALFEHEWSLGVDASLLNKPLSLGGRVYAKGLAMHSRSEAMFRIENSFSQFAATAGISDEMRERGCVSMRVLGDGRVLWEAAQVRGGEAPRDVLVSLRGVRDLTLLVDFDEDLDLGDHAVWAFARLLR